MKKLLSILLAAVMMFGMTLGVSAATIGSGIRGINEKEFATLIAKNKITLNDKTALSLSDLTDLEPNPGDVIKIYLTGNLFLDRSKNVIGKISDDVSKSALSAGGVDVRTTSTSGAGALTVTIDGNKSNSYIKIEFSKSPEYDKKKFTYSVYLTYNGARKSATRIGVKGTLAAEEVEVNSGDFYVDLSEGVVAKANANVRNVELYLGEYCTVFRTLTRGKTYRGLALTDVLEKDEVLYEKYPYLEYIYRLQTVGLKAEGNIVKFDLEDTYYVYNTNGTYLGTSDKALTYWTKYYLTSKKYDKIEVIK